MSPFTTLGLDPSLTGFGWAIHAPAAQGKARCPDRGRFQTSSKTEEIDRYTDQRESVRDLLLRYPDIRYVAVESPFFGAEYSEGMYALFVQVQQVLKEARRDVAFLAVSRIKAFAREKLDRPSWWKVDKLDTVEVAKTDTGPGRWNNDEADAYVAAMLGSRFWQLLDGDLGTDDLTEYETKAFLDRKSGLVRREGDRFYRWSPCGDRQRG